MFMTDEIVGCVAHTLRFFLFFKLAAEKQSRISFWMQLLSDIRNIYVIGCKISLKFHDFSKIDMEIWQQSNCWTDSSAKQHLSFATASHTHTPFGLNLYLYVYTTVVIKIKAYAKFVCLYVWFVCFSSKKWAREIRKSEFMCVALPKRN